MLTVSYCSKVNWKAVVKKDHDGNEMIECEIDLGPYESSDVPEQFMVVRTWLQLCVKIRMVSSNALVLS